MHMFLCYEHDEDELDDETDVHKHINEHECMGKLQDHKNTFQVQENDVHIWMYERFLDFLFVSFFQTHVHALISNLVYFLFIQLSRNLKC